MNPNTGDGNSLQGKRVAALMTGGVEQVEYTEPRGYLEARGAAVTLVSPKAAGEEIQAFNHLTPASTFKVERNVHDVGQADFDMLVLPGGVANPDLLRLSGRSIDFVREFSVGNKPIAAICHGPWTLINADVVADKRVTSWPSLEVDQEVVIDGKLVASRKPADIPAFSRAVHVLFEDADMCPPRLGAT
jgi:protease I